MKSTELNEQDIEEIEKFAYKYLDKIEIARLMEIDDKESFEDEDSKVFKAFWKGRYKRKATFNASLIALSDQLSSPAQAIESKLAERTALNDKKRIK